MNGVEKAFEWNGFLTKIEAVHPNCFVRQMKILPCDEIGCPTTGVSQPLRFREVCLFASQLLRQQLLLGDVHRGAAVSLKHSIFSDWNADAPDVSNLAIGAHYPVRDIAAAMLLMEFLHCCCQRGLVLGMNRTQELLKTRSSIFGVEPENLVNLVRPVDIQIFGPTNAQICRRPTPDVSKAFPFAEMKLALLQSL